MTTTNPTCLHCQSRQAAKKRRGLCYRCAKTPGVLEKYPKRKPGNPAADSVSRFWARVQKCEGCWLWTGRTNTESGYGYFDYGPRCRTSVPAHRYSWELHNGTIPDGMHVLHRCDNPPCVNPDHLFLGTNLDNVRDKQAKGRQLRGERVGTAKFTAGQVTEVRRRVAGGETQLSVARDMGMSPRHVHDIVTRRTWAWLPDAELLRTGEG